MVDPIVVDAPAIPDTPVAAEAATEAPEQSTMDNGQGEALDDAIVASEEERGPIAEVEASIEDVANLETDDEILNSDENYTGIDYNQVLSELPEDARKLVANLRRSFTKKSQEVSSKRKNLDVQLKAIEAERAAIIESDFYTDLKETADPAEETPFDPYDAKSMEKRIEQEVAMRLKQMLQPMREQHIVQQRKANLAMFRTEHPDLEDHKYDVADVLKANDHMTLEQAYWQVKGRKAHVSNKQAQQELKAYRQAAKDAGLKVGGANRGKTKTIPKYVADQGAVAIYQWLEANPQVKV
jgi:hypothetical protein